MIPLAKPFISTRRYINDALNDNQLSIGKYNEMVEEMLPEFTGCRFNLLVSSGTTANVLMNIIVKDYPVKRLIVPNNCYVAAYNPFVDNFDFKVSSISEDTWNMPIDNDFNIEKNHALLVVHNIGNPVNVPKIKRLFPGKTIIEDNCEGFLGKYEGKPTGSESLMSSLSFFGNKIITSGEGGCFCTNDESIYNLAKLLSTQAMSKRRYVHLGIAYNFRMTNIQAALLYTQLVNIHTIKEARREIFSIYDDLLYNFSRIKLQYEDKDCEHSHWMYGIRIVDNKSYDKVESWMSIHGIETRPLFYPIHCHEQFKDLHSTATSIKLSKECVLLPTYVGLKKKEQERIVDVLTSYMQKIY